MEIDNTKPHGVYTRRARSRYTRDGDMTASQEQRDKKTEDSTVVFSDEVSQVLLSGQTPRASDTPFDEQKVKTICDAIRAGKYEVDSEKIAEALIKDMASLLAR